MPDPVPGVTVVVPTLNRGGYLVDTVRDLLAQDYRPLEILIVDQSDQRSPALEALVAAHPDVISHHRVKFRGLPVARNYGWQMALHELIVYVDDDIRCGPSLIGAYHQLLTAGKVHLCGGAVDGEMHASCRTVGAYNRWLSRPTSCFAAHGVRDVDHVKGCNFAMRRALAAQLSGFDERMAVGAALHEETDFMLRALALGSPIVFDGRIRLVHLAAGAGGTRQRDIGSYVYALCHNRSVMIRRHSLWYQWPFGVAYSIKLAASYAVTYRQPRALVLGIRGLRRGWRAGGAPPQVTTFAPDASP